MQCSKDSDRLFPDLNVLTEADSSRTAQMSVQPAENLTQEEI